jgi:ubiquinol-cytochrome c reductase iron-sulfur subunit
MAETLIAQKPTRREFLYVASAAATSVGLALATWPFIAQMNPAADTLALSSTEVDLGPIVPGQSITVLWRQRPVFVRHRTEREIEAARAVPLSDLIDPQSDESRVLRSEWLVVVGVCTHLGCVPIAHQGPYDGFLCPCHGSVYDTSGRVRRGPAPRNLDVPVYKFLSNTRIEIG